MSAFWTFTLGIYAERRVQSALLHLQDDRDADVNLLLYALWSASTGLPPLESDRIRRLAGLVRGWRVTAIEPLRAIRNALDDGVRRAPRDDVRTLRSGVLRSRLKPKGSSRQSSRTQRPGPWPEDGPPRSNACGIKPGNGRRPERSGPERGKHPGHRNLVEAASSAGGTDVARAMAVFRESLASSVHAHSPIV